MRLSQKQKPPARSSRWLAASILLSSAIVIFAARPVFKNPQLEPDDYRYFHQVQLLNENFWGNIATASVVENHWDHLWWVKLNDKVLFFRPTVVLSYWLDSALYGKQYELGALITNIAVYLFCVFFVCLI